MNKLILIIAAMEDIELELLIEKLEGLNKVTYNSFNFYEGRLLGKDVVICESKIGLINSVATTVIRNRKISPTENNKFRLSRRIYKRYTYRRYCSSDLTL